MTNFNDYYDLNPSGFGFPKTTRFEVIDDNGRKYSAFDCKVKLSFQDDGRTIKMFVSKNTDDELL